MRFFGGNYPNQQIDRVRIRLDAPQVPADIGATDFTVEVWLKANGAAGTCQRGQDNWITGRIFIDQDIFGVPEHGDWGLSVMGPGVIAFGVATSTGGDGLCGSTRVTDGQWHHVAVTREVATGQLRLFVDGVLDGQAGGNAGDVSYKDGRTGAAADPYLTLGGEKHALAGYPWFDGWLDELRLSSVVRYRAAFTAPKQPFRPDPATAALYHFDEGGGSQVVDSSGAAGGPSHGTRLVGGSPAGPAYSADVPF